jgi:hypothetical protein
MQDPTQEEKWNAELSWIPRRYLREVKRAVQGARHKVLARIFARYILTKDSYNSVFLLSKKGNESAGIVDLVAIKKHPDEAGKLDATEIILLQVKGNGKATEEERKRLLNARQKVRVSAGLIEYAPGCLPKVDMLLEVDSAQSSGCEAGVKSVTPSERERALMAAVVSEERIPGGPGRPESVKRVDPKRSAAATKAWETIRRNRQLKAEA